jgi:hypothetical protein
LSRLAGGRLELGLAGSGLRGDGGEQAAEVLSARAAGGQVSGHARAAGGWVGARRKIRASLVASGYLDEKKPGSR